MPTAKSSASVPLPQTWIVQRDQMTVKNSHIVFAIKNINISDKEIRIFYAIHTSGKTRWNVFSVVD